MKKNVFLVLLGVALIWSNKTYAQQLPQYSQYMRNQYMVNPAAAGLYNFLDVTLSGRWQWLGFKNSPMTTYLAATTPIGHKPAKFNPSLRISDASFNVSSGGVARNPEITTGKLKHAIGGQMVADQYGAFRKMHFAGTYAIHVPVFRGYNLSFGMKAGLANNAFLRDRVSLLNPNDQTFTDYTATGNNLYFLDLGAGVYLYSQRLFVGISTDQITRDFVKFGDGQSLEFDQHMHFFGIAGYKINIAEELTITPAVLAKFMRPAPVSVELTMKLEYKEWIWGGISFRNADALIAMFGMNINHNLKFGYSYDLGISGLRSYNAGGHELILGLMLGR
jgi:type IX secretion system PorP/SprF family membrane protein